jgi:hypothetical protein
MDIIVIEGFAPDALGLPYIGLFGYVKGTSKNPRAPAFTFSHEAQKGNPRYNSAILFLGRGIMEITDGNIQEMGEYLDGIPEPRRTAYGNIRHKLMDILVIAFTATLCGSDEFEEMEEFGQLKYDFFKGFLELPNGMPDESTFRKIISRLDPVELHKSMDNWLVDIAER